MVAANTKKVELSWNDVIDGNFPEPESTARRIFRETLAEVADKARQALPESNGRVDKAVQIVLAGDVLPCEDGRFFVGAQSDTKNYLVLDNECDCPDFDRAPDRLCKHVIATMLWRRAYPQANAKMEALDNANSHVASPHALPEAPVSITLKGTIAGQEAMITLRGVNLTDVWHQVESAASKLDQPETLPMCPKHNAQMKKHTKNGKSWHSHKTQDGWCNG
jgi:hypothetical protein